MNRKVLLAFLIASIGTSTSFAHSSSQDVQALERQVSSLQTKQTRVENDLRKLQNVTKKQSSKILSLEGTVSNQQQLIDSLQTACHALDSVQSADRDTINGKFDATNTSIKANHTSLESRTTWGAIITFVLILLLLGIAYFLLKKIKKGTSSIDDVRKAQDALQAAQEKMQEESIKLDDKLLEVLNKQIAVQPASSVPNDKGTVDHSLALKVADEIVRIELNMSRMDSSIKGYKQLTKAVERIKNNFQANGYEIVDMLGKPYNEGMKVVANFVVDDTLEAGKQIITGITKPQINYNGQMIQAAQITVSQNI